MHLFFGFDLQILVLFTLLLPTVVITIVSSNLTSRENSDIRLVCHVPHSSICFCSSLSLTLLCRLTIDIYRS